MWAGRVKVPTKKGKREKTPRKGVKEEKTPKTVQREQKSAKKAKEEKGKVCCCCVGVCCACFVFFHFFSIVINMCACVQTEGIQDSDARPKTSVFCLPPKEKGERGEKRSKAELPIQRQFGGVITRLTLAMFVAKGLNTGNRNEDQIEARKSVLKVVCVVCVLCVCCVCIVSV